MVPAHPKGDEVFGPRGMHGGEDSPETPGIPQGGSEPHHIPITDALDLHAIAPRDIPEAVEEYLWEAAREGLREVRIIHGKGTGYQRSVVAGVLEKHPAVESFRQASADRGHWGATIALLRSSAQRPD